MAAIIGLLQLPGRSGGLDMLISAQACMLVLHSLSLLHLCFSMVCRGVLGAVTGLEKFPVRVSEDGDLEKFPVRDSEDGDWEKFPVRDSEDEASSLETRTEHFSKSVTL